MNINIDAMFQESETNKGRISGLDNLLRQAYANCVEVMASNYIYQNQIKEFQSQIAALKKENEELKAQNSNVSEDACVPNVSCNQPQSLDTLQGNVFKNANPV